MLCALDLCVCGAWCDLVFAGTALLQLAVLAILAIDALHSEPTDSHVTGPSKIPTANQSSWRM